jgi:hypothetical protein
LASPLPTSVLEDQLQDLSNNSSDIFRFWHNPDRMAEIAQPTSWDNVIEHSIAHSFELLEALTLTENLSWETSLPSDERKSCIRLTANPDPMSLRRSPIFSLYDDSSEELLDTEPDETKATNVS